LKKLKFNVEAIIGDRYESTDSLSKNEVHNWLVNIQKQDILKVETKNDYWEDIPQDLFELLKINIKDKNYDYTMAKGHLWLEMEILLEP
jgi:CTP:phosphocholine cytidylyltransferase-like protein